jgi:predicted alpha/beta hydrolase family esterase
MSTSARVLILPGLWNSGPEHWQTHWERADASFVRVEQRDWVNPVRWEWVAVLEAAVAAVGPDVVLAAHSAGCALAAFWAAATTRAVRGALLVAPADTEAASFPDGPSGWRPMPLAALPFPSIVVASRDDPFVTIDRARLFAQAWGSRLVDAGAAGHLNAASGLGAWPRGRALVDGLLGVPNAAA